MANKVTKKKAAGRSSGKTAGKSGGKGASGSGGSSFKAKLAKAGRAYAKKAEEFGDRNFVEMEDGTYMFRLTNAEVKESQNGNLGTNFEFTCVRGDDKGNKHFEWCTLENENMLWKLHRMLRALGVENASEIDLAKELEEVLAELVKERPGLRGRLKTRTWEGENGEGESQELSILRMLPDLEDDVDDDDEDGDDGETDEEEETEEEEEDEETEEEEEVELSKGDRITAEIDGETYAGKIISIKDEEAKCKFDDGDVMTLPLDELSAEDEESEEEEEEDEEGDGDDDETVEEGDGDDDEDVELSVGDTVVYDDAKGKEVEGKVTKINEKGGYAMVKTGKKQVKKQLEDLTVITD